MTLGLAKAAPQRPLKAGWDEEPARHERQGGPKEGSWETTATQRNGAWVKHAVPPERLPQALGNPGKQNKDIRVPPAMASAGLGLLWVMMP